MISKQDFKNFQVYLDCAKESTQQIFTAVFLPKAHIKGDFPISSHFISSLIDQPRRQIYTYNQPPQD